MRGAPFSSHGWCVVVAACVASVPVQALAQTKASTPSSTQVELLRGAQMWSAKNRADLARQLIEKLLAQS